MEESKNVASSELKRFARYGVEEIARRALKNASPMSKEEILKLCVPNYIDIVSEVKAQVQAEIEASMKSSDGDEYAQY